MAWLPGSASNGVQVAMPAEQKCPGHAGYPAVSKLVARVCRLNSPPPLSSEFASHRSSNWRPGRSSRPSRHTFTSGIGSGGSGGATPGLTSHPACPGYGGAGRARCRPVKRQCPAPRHSSAATPHPLALDGVPSGQASAWLGVGGAYRPDRRPPEAERDPYRRRESPLACARPRSRTCYPAMDEPRRRS